MRKVPSFKTLPTFVKDKHHANARNQILNILYQNFDLDKFFFGRLRKARIDGGIDHLELSFENTLKDVSSILSFEKAEEIVTTPIIDKSIVGKRREFINFLEQNKDFSSLFELTKAINENIASLIDTSGLKISYDFDILGSMNKECIETENKPETNDEHIRGNWEKIVQGKISKTTHFIREYSFFQIIFQLHTAEDIVNAIETDNFDSLELNGAEIDFIKDLLKQFKTFIENLDRLQALLKDISHPLIQKEIEKLDSYIKDFKLDRSFEDILKDLIKDGDYYHKITFQITKFLKDLLSFIGIIFVVEYQKRVGLNNINYDKDKEIGYTNGFSLKPDIEHVIPNHSTDDKQTIIFQAPNGSGKTFYENTDIVNHVLAQTIGKSAVEKGNFRFYNHYFYFPKLQSQGTDLKDDLSAWLLEGDKLNEIYKKIKNTKGNVYIELDETGATSDENSEFLILKKFIEALEKLAEDQNRIIRLKISSHNEQLTEYFKQNENISLYTFDEKHNLERGTRDSETLQTFKNLLSKLDEDLQGIGEEMIKLIEDFLNGNPKQFENPEIEFVKGKVSLTNDEIQEESKKFVGLWRLFNVSDEYKIVDERFTERLKTSFYKENEKGYFSMKYDERKIDRYSSCPKWIFGNIPALVEKQKVIEYLKNPEFKEQFNQEIKKIQDFISITAMILGFYYRKYYKVAYGKYEKDENRQERENIYESLLPILTGMFHGRKSYFGRTKDEIQNIDEEIKVLNSILSAFGMDFNSFLSPKEKENIYGNNKSEDEKKEFLVQKIKNIFDVEIEEILKEKKLFIEDIIFKGKKINIEKIDIEQLTDSDLIISLRNYYNFIEHVNSFEEKTKPFMDDSLDVIKDFLELLHNTDSLFFKQLANYTQYMIEKILGKTGEYPIKVGDKEEIIKKMDFFENFDHIFDFIINHPEKKEYIYEILKNFLIGETSIQTIIDNFEYCKEDNTEDSKNFAGNLANKRIDTEKLFEYMQNDATNPEIILLSEFFGFDSATVSFKGIRNIQDVFAYIDFYKNNKEKLSLLYLGDNFTRPNETTGRSNKYIFLPDFYNGANYYASEVSKIIGKFTERIPSYDGLTKVEFTDKRIFEIQNMEQIEGRKIPNFVKNSIKLTSKKPILLVNGVNASGKTELLNTVISYINKALDEGYVDADKMIMGAIDDYAVIDRVYVEQNFSSGETDIITWLKLLKEIENKDLVIVNVDEVFTTMNKKYSFAFAYNFVGKLLESGKLGIIISHNHTFVDKFSQLDGVEVAKFDSYLDENGKVVHTHKLIPGKIEDSYGIEVLKNKFPDIEWI